MRLLLLAVAAVAVVAGGVWWAGGAGVIGPIVAGLGVALLIVVVQHSRR